MEKSQYDLRIEVLRRLDKAGILKDIVLVGNISIRASSNKRSSKYTLYNFNTQTR